ncbi:MAG TPA: DUF4340 domain-containing protein [Rhodopila sp.]
MRGRAIALLVLLGILALAAGWYFGAATTPAERTTVAAGQLMFPDLAPKLKDVTRVDITHQGKQTVIRKRSDGSWGLASLHDYPVQEAKLRGVLTGLTELRLAEPRTSDPAEFSRLGVDDPNAAGSSADLLQIADGTGKPIVAVILGHRRVRSQANVPDEIYVRRPDQNQSWLAEGSLQVDADPASWLDRNIMDIGQDRIASVVVGDQALVFGRQNGKFTLTQPTEHPKLEDYKVDDVARALVKLTFQQVKADADAPGTEAGRAVFTTNDGLAVTVHVFHADKDGADKDGANKDSANKDVWARFTAAAATDKAKPEADKLNGRLAGWTYQVNAWQEKSLVPTMDDLKAPEPQKPEPQKPEPQKPETSDTDNK